MARTTRSSAVKAEATAPPVIQKPLQLSSPPATPVPRNARKRKAAMVEDSPKTTSSKAPITPKSTKRAKKVAVKEEDVNELPHNLGAIPHIAPKEEVDDAIPPKKTPNNAKKATKPSKVKKEDADDLVAKATMITDESPKKKGKAKNSNYGLTPGQTPYPNYPHPTAEECEEVTRLLSKVHGKVQAPKTIPAPSLNVSGCGEVPSVLDALIRTRLSAATSGTNSSRAFAGLVAKFGILKEGIGKGSVDWNKVRQAEQKEIFEAIKSGGLADVKSKDIKKILQMVWEENQTRRDAHLSVSDQAPGSINEAAEEKNAEVEKAEQNIVSLDHLHLLSNDDAFNALTKYPGIGPKTASCVLLFCLQRPSFAVDTHVFRLCKWLGWVPAPGDPAGLAPGAKGTFAGPTRNSTYAHCEVRVPDDLKYPLHQLLIKHGKSCPRCRAITGESSEGWEKGCALDHLVKRSGGRKEGLASPAKAASGKKPKAKGKKKAVEEYESDAKSSGESEAESSDLSDLVSDAEVEHSEDEQSASD
ncbi:base excision DNA repair protein [Cucurbitaria berberidis CBS 394.84]|uniref:Base excision DNA repair protein n=1 Tax=Cucurbitaria berberidis CBS 394.84 TaxID=1168544 RepID=A0A9P4GU14_9PLEO|nr:base excision DNA repair protein [Cucurbitaria berberidis CBS 394.84]KAF1851807.1 base excision DNA repair protein [Cucurbitaria berberidis CBS 394.84]